MAEVCPYRVHSKRPPPEPTKWYHCPNCGKRHRTEQARVLCAGYSAWHKAFAEFKTSFSATGFNPEGTTEEIYPDDLIKFPGFQNVRAHLWPVMMGAIKHRDKGKCQDCGTQEGCFEVHHIIPRGMGGSDHPANLKLVCQNCHKKYNEQFNGQIISKKAQERKTKTLHKTVNPLESFEVGP
jgi:5-methylcytosine-specific restriction protein A